MNAACPACTEEYGRKSARQTRAVPLKLIEHNYSGCGVDMAYCPKCGKGYCVSYKVDKITPDPAWDVVIDRSSKF